MVVQVFTKPLDDRNASLVMSFHLIFIIQGKNCHLLIKVNILYCILIQEFEVDGTLD